MNWWTPFRYWVGALISKSRLEQEMADEVREHLDERAERYIESGMFPEEARNAAKRDFGGVDQLKERCRDQRGWVWPEQTMKDFRFAVRSLAKSPGFTLAVVATLAIGIGATTAIISIARRVVFPAIPYPEPERIVVMTDSGFPDSPSRAPFPFFGFPYRFAVVHDVVTSFASLGAISMDEMNLVVRGDPAGASVAMVTADFFEVLGATPQIGRLFLPSEFRGENGEFAVLTWRIWNERFDADPGIVGQDIFLGGKPRRVVGVLSREFTPPPQFSYGEIYLPFAPSQASITKPFRWIQAVGRLKSDKTPEQAAAELALIHLPVPSSSRAAYWECKERLVPLTSYYRSDTTRLFWVFLGAVGCLYAIACSNAASLMLARTVARRHELGMRLAIGASRWQIIRLLLSESFAVALIGCGVGLVIATWSCSAMAPLLPWEAIAVGGRPPAIDRSMLAVALTLAVLTCGIVVIVPALRVQSARLNDILKEGVGSLGDSRLLNRLRATLVVIQTALAVALLAGTGLMARSIMRLQKLDLGFDPTSKLTVTGSLPQGMSQEGYLQLVERLRVNLTALPGVQDVTFSQTSPFSSISASSQVKIVGRPELGEIKFRLFSVSPEYFTTLGLPILMGRGLDGLKRGDPPAAIINNATAQRYFNGSSPIGRQLDLGDDGMCEIIGITGDVRDSGLRQEVGPQIYLPFWQMPVDTDYLIELVRLKGPPTMDFERLIRRAAYKAEPRLVVRVQRLADQDWQWIQKERYTMVVLQVLSALALALAAMGMFAVMAYTVAQRQRDFGVRMALGAARGDLQRIVLRRGLALAVFGVVAGLAVAWGLTRFLESVLFEISPHDPLTYAGVAVVLIGVAVAACWLPARRAARVDVARLLRAE
jgi:putative ABC transport system permease protein